MGQRPIPTAVRHVPLRFRTRLRQPAILLRGERAPRLPLVPKPTCVTYVAFCSRPRESVDSDAIPYSTVTRSPSITMGRRLILSVANLAHSKQRRQELQEEHP
jgi:hypothetical protein